jgi:glycine dehydrogenase subunit 1
VAERLLRLPNIAADPAGRLYPAWPELWPVLMLSVSGAIGDDVPDRLAAALAGG